MKKILPFILFAILATPAFAQQFDVSLFKSIGLPEILLWILTFAVVYGILSHVGEKGIPQSVAARAIIALVAAFFVLMAAPGTLTQVIEKMTGSLILLVIGIIVLIVILEVAGIRVGGKYLGIHPETKEPMYEKKVPIFEKYSYLFAILFILIAIMVFVLSGGLQVLGIEKISLDPGFLTGIFVIIIILIAMGWMIKG